MVPFVLVKTGRLPKGSRSTKWIRNTLKDVFVEGSRKDPLMRASKRRGGVRNHPQPKGEIPDRGLFPRAWGPPKDPVERIRSWKLGSSNGPVLGYASRVLNTCIGNLTIPEWFYSRFGVKTHDLRRKFKFLPVWKKLLVSYVRVMFHLYQSNKAPLWVAFAVARDTPVSVQGLRFHFRNLPEVLRTSCRITESNLSARTLN
jgi:hypothetical protein